MSTDFWSDLIATSTRRVGDWERLWPEFVADESVTVSEEIAAGVLGELAEQLRITIPFPSCVRGPDVETASSDCRRGLCNGSTDQPERPCARRRTSNGPTGAGSRPRVDGHVRLSGRIESRSSDLEWNDRQSGGALGGQGTASNAWYCILGGLPLHPRAHVSGVTHVRCRCPGDFPRPNGSRRAGGSSTFGKRGDSGGHGRDTSLGAVDPIAEIVELARSYDARVHVDAAYGGFFRLLSGDSDSPLEPGTSRALRAISDADSVVIDPHKHGLQPYGCGSVLFRNAAVGQFYKHDSPYTYFTSDELHLGEISLECSRAGAAAAALWATLRALPLESHGGIGAILRQTRYAARRWSDIMREDFQVQLVIEPELDILGFYCPPPSGSRRTSEISALTQQRFSSLMNGSPINSSFWRRFVALNVNGAP